VHRPGGPYALVTGLAAFLYDRDRHRFRLASIHPGHSLEELRDLTGFAFDCPDRVPETAAPDPEWCAALHGPIREQIAEVYPEFARTRLVPPASAP
jgi:glutaconate CoA-transferase subunit B